MLARGICSCFLYTAHNSVDNCLVVVLRDKLVTELDVLGLGILLAQASVDLLLPLVVLGLALYAVSGRSSWSSARARRSRIELSMCWRHPAFDDLVIKDVGGDRQRTATLNMPGFSALLKSLPSATLAKEYNCRN